MAKKDLREVYTERLNAILLTVNFTKLNCSCNSMDYDYAKDILKRMHDTFIEVYGIDHLDNYSYEFIEIPAVIRGRNTGHMGLGIVTLDLESSGEHWGTFFLTPRGVIEQNSENMRDADRKYLNQTYIPYDYWYTVSVERDHHVDFNNVPEKIADLLNACYPNQLGMEMEQYNGS